MQREVKYTNSVPTVGDVMREGISKLQNSFLEHGLSRFSDLRFTGARL